MPASRPAVSITALEHALEGRELFGGLDLTIQSGTVHALVGASGVGKSTLLRMIGGLQRPHGGSIRSFEHDVTTLRGAKLRRYLRHDIGFVFQDAGLIEEWTVRRNLHAAAKAASDHPTSPPMTIEAAIDRLDLPRTLLGQRAAELSGGERQRAAIARILVRKPPLVLLDEPTAALDGRRTTLINEIAHELVDQGATIVVASHDEHLLQSADERTSIMTH